MNPHRLYSRAPLMLTFAHIVECGSISGAAAQLGLDKAAVSRQLRDLEELLEVRLMHRSTRRLTLTEVGGVVYERAQRILHELEHAHQEAQALRSLPSGVLTVSTSVAFGKLHVVPLVPAFMQRYPDIELQLCLLDRQADLVDEGMDVLLRLCNAPPEHLVAHPLCAVDYAVVATPEVAQAGPEVRTPADLAQRNCLFYGFKSRQATWRLRLGSQEHTVEVRTRVSVNSSESVRELALQGLGVALLPGFAIAADLRQGRLVRLLPDYEVEGNLGRHLYALHLPGRYTSPKVRAFVAFVRERWAGPEASRWEGPATAPTPGQASDGGVEA